MGDFKKISEDIDSMLKDCEDFFYRYYQQREVEKKKHIKTNKWLEGLGKEGLL